MNVIKMPESDYGTRVSQGELLTLAERKKACEACNRKHKCRGERCNGCELDTRGLLTGLDPYQRQWVDWQSRPFISATPWYESLFDNISLFIGYILGFAGIALIGFGVWGFVWLVMQVVKELR